VGNPKAATFACVNAVNMSEAPKAEAGADKGGRLGAPALLLLLPAFQLHARLSALRQLALVAACWGRRGCLGALW
jgi:hypothetical protein